MNPIQIVVLWIIPIVLLIPSLSGLFGRHALECNSRICTLMEDDGGNNPKNLLKFLAVVGPVIILTAADISIFFRMRVQTLTYLFYI